MAWQSLPIAQLALQLPFQHRLDDSVPPLRAAVQGLRAEDAEAAGGEGGGQGAAAGHLLPLLPRATAAAAHSHRPGPPRQGG